LLDENTDKFPLGPCLEYLEDKNREWGIEEVSSDAFDKKFVSEGNEVLNFGYTASAYWIRFHLSYFPKKEMSERELFLELRYPLIDYVELWISAGDGKWTVKKTGDRLPFSHREVAHHNIVFRIKVIPGEQTLYLRTESRGAMEIPLVLWSPVGFAEKVNKKQYFSGIYYGVMSAMVLYNLFLFFSVRDWSFLFCVMYIVSYMLFQASLSGEGYEYLWGDFPIWFNQSVPFFIMMTGFWMAQFSKSFLNTRENSYLADKILSFFMAGAVAIMILSLTTSNALSVRIATAWFMAEIIAVLATGVLCLYRGYRAARYFMIAWFVFLAGTLIYFLKMLGIFPATSFTSYTMQLGSAMLVILLSLGLADRINVERKAKLLAREDVLNAQEEVLRAQEEAAEILEKEVADRTGELRASLDQVEYANKHIMESICYAEKIQRSLLPSHEMLRRYFDHKYFIIDEPKHIVGGDIYLFEKFENGCLIALIDCTGHGVPGALMTMLSGTMFKQIVQGEYYDNPARILKSLNMAVKISLYTQKKKADSDDGMDAGICFLNTETRVLTFAGARFPLTYITDDGTLHTIKGDRQSLGYKNANTGFEFTNHQIPLRAAMSFYMSTDGIRDQIGGPGSFPFGNSRFYDLLREVRKQAFEEQRNIILRTYMKWKDDEEQRDDVTVVGFEFGNDTARHK